MLECTAFATLDICMDNGGGGTIELLARKSAWLTFLIIAILYAEDVDAPLDHFTCTTITETMYI